MPYRPASDALADIRVLDLTRARAGPTAVRQLADWGADVIKIELPESIEPDGTTGAPRTTPDFQNLQRNKRSLTLNLKEPEGVEIFKRLVERADVVVENFRPGVKDRLGIDYENLSAVNPRLVYASISGFGQSGPYRDRPGFDQVAQGMGGLMSITGLPGQGPVRVGIPVADLCAGLFCALGILTALHERERSGRGQWVHTSLLEAMVFMLDFQAARWLIGGEVPGQAGNDHPTSTPTGVYETSDGHINIAVGGQRMWRRFCDALEAPGMRDDPGYATNADRLANRPRLTEEINAITRTRSSQDWIGRFAEAGVPSGEILSIDKVFAHPQVEHLGIAAPVESASRGRMHLVTQAVKLERTPSRLACASPERGEHSDEILAELGLGADEIEQLRRRAVV
ncbi:MAG: CoA transferase [Gammaproteobacteria bacterium]|nr:CoA transferase [Gammaproteobacteria bacterium]